MDGKDENSKGSFTYKQVNNIRSDKDMFNINNKSKKNVLSGTTIIIITPIKHTATRLSLYPFMLKTSFYTNIFHDNFTAVES